MKSKQELIRGLSSSRSGDVLILLTKGNYFEGYENEIWGYRANHGSLYDEDLNVPLILANGGIVHGLSKAPVGTVNIAKTIAQYLDFSMDEGEPSLPGVSFQGD